MRRRAIGAATLLIKEGVDWLSDWAVGNVTLALISVESDASDVTIRPRVSGFVTGSIDTQNCSQ
jgi:hypothetical protein